ncbi:hypothetical protein PbJCM13498_23730 [Prolixibacter bellariivorans]|uniref:Uncharacterized protein n=1 Tax=Prolixibacter bellariivorans TaxID=314319 RepID=A0A5M4B035_9BACT|nr:hypothetical protein PbJCM13498_23730 [Prolixibacter bellariivorans]
MKDVPIMGTDSLIICCGICPYVRSVDCFKAVNLLILIAGEFSLKKLILGNLAGYCSDIKQVSYVDTHL